MGCVLAEPIVDGLEVEFAGRLTVVRVDIYTPAGRELGTQFATRLTPTFVLLDGSGIEGRR